ncbi:MAG: PKD domain-containing protein [Bacteroidota bacterium]
MVYFIKKILRITLLICLYNNTIIVAQSSFSPSAIPGLKLWLRSDTGVVLTGNLIDKWDDISGNSNNAFQSISSLKPTWYVSDTLLNNYPAVKFDGVSSNLETMYAQPDAYSVFIVYAHRNGNNGSFYSTNQSGYPLQRNSTIWPNSNLAPYGLGAGDLINIRNLYVDVHDFLNNNYATYLNGIFRGGFNNTISKSGGTFHIGIGGGEPLDGSIAEFLVYNQPLTDSLRMKVENYLINRYAPAINLGPDKTVCTFPITLKAKKNYYTNYLWQDNSNSDSLVIMTSGTYSITVTNIFGKTSSDTINITIDNSAVVASLPNDTTICSGKSIKIIAGPPHLNYTWSNGLTTNSITINSSGLYKVSMIDCMANISTDSIHITIKPLPFFNFVSKDTIICKNSGFILDPNFSNSLPLIFNWNDNSHDSIHPISLNGKYFLEVVDNIGCSFSDTITIQIDSSLLFATLGPNLSLCAGNLITLTSGTSPSLTYTWSSGSNNDSLLINNSGQYSVIVTNTNNCIARDTINVSITGQAPAANFTTGISCFGSAVSFTNLSTASSGNTITTVNWDFGDPLSASSNTSTVSNPFHMFSDTGNYIIRLNVITNVGCEQAVSKTIHIAPKPVVNFSIGNSCQNDSTAFTNLSTSIAGYSITSLNWNFGDGNTSIGSNPKHIFTNQSNYTIKLVATNNVGCKDSLTNIIAVKAQVKADFTYSTPCTNTTTVFQDNSIASSSAPNTRTWYLGGPSVPGLTVPKTYTATGPYTVSLTVSVNGCNSSISKIITIFSQPIANFTLPAFCSKDTVTAINSSLAQSGVLSSYSWKLNNIAFSSVQNPTLSLTSAGNYPVRLTVVNSFGCKDSITKTVNVNPLPVVDFTTNPVNYYYINSSVNFIPSINNANSYFWNFPGISTSTLQSPSVSFNSEGTYTVSLNLLDQQGCKGSKTKTILVAKRFLDLAILNVTTIKDDEGFMTVLADIANYGTIPASTIDMQYQISDGGNNKETWNGSLSPNSYFTYTFNSKSASEGNSVNNITCVSIKKVNSIPDENQNNNDLCSSLNYDEISVSNPFPNPTTENLTLPIILNKDIEFTMSIYNSTGQIMLEETTQKGIMGLNLLYVPTSFYAWGGYVIKVTIDDKLFIKKFIKVNN